MALPKAVSHKLLRAREHIFELDAAIGYYLQLWEDEIIHIEVHEHKDGSHWRLVGRWPAVVPPPLRIALLVGDAVHNMRSTLDHLACALVLAKGNKPVVGSGGTQFPIFSSATNDRGNPRQITVAGGVAEEALALIEGLQPYNRSSQDPDSDPLAVVANLDNADKHHTLQIASAVVSATRVRCVLGDGRDVSVVFTPAMLDNEHETVVMSDPIPQRYLPMVEMESQGTFGVALKESGPWETVPVGDVLKPLYDYIGGDVLPQFSKFF